MGVLDFEAYELEYLSQNGGRYNASGDYVKGSDEWVNVGRCNAVPAGRNNVIGIPDGQTTTFSFTIILHDPNSREYKYGERLRLKTINGSETIDLTVKGFARYQYQCKIYA